MLATAIAEDEWDDSPATQPVTVELSAAQVEVLRSVVSLLGDPSSCDAAATLAGLLRWVSAAADTPLLLDLAARYLEQVARARRVRVVNLEASTEIK